jgi:hypothetical protein
MIITITLPPETEARLRQRAADSGRSLDAYLRHLVERDVAYSVEERFQQLADEWRQAVAPLSSVTRIVAHPAYQAIIALGEPVVPLILRDLAREPDHWFVALRTVTGADPVPPEDAGKMDRMAAAWVRWGKEHGYAP